MNENNYFNLELNQGFVLQLSEELKSDFTIKYGDTTVHTQKFPITILPAEFFIHGFIRNA